MPRIEALLGEDSAGNLTFTLHDPDHAYRVAQRMADIIPADVLRRLSAYELSLLLLSAYVHDIGLAPASGDPSAKICRQGYAGRQVHPATSSPTSALVSGARVGFAADVE